MAKMTINAPEAPAAVGPYVHAVKANGFVFLIQAADDHIRIADING